MIYLHNSLQNDIEIVGTLRGFDEYVNMVLDDVTEIRSGPSRKEVRFMLVPSPSLMFLVACCADAFRSNTVERCEYLFHGSRRGSAYVTH
jgi:hypothetical protein